MKSRRIKWVNPLFIIFLALAGVFGVSSALVSEQAMETKTAEKAEAADTNLNFSKVYRFRKPTEYWGETVYIHIWGSSTSSNNTTWPGINISGNMSYNELSQKVYAFGTNVTDYKYIIFHNNSGWQTDNITIGSNTAWQLDSGNTPGTWTPSNQTYYFYDYRNLLGGNAQCYAWQSGGPYQNAKYPGTAMSKVQYGSGVLYSITLDPAFDEFKIGIGDSVNTGDIWINQNRGHCYCWWEENPGWSDDLDWVKAHDWLYQTMHIRDVATTDNSDTGKCRGTGGYYEKAKTAYNSFSAAIKTKISQDSAWGDAQARFSAWAKSNGETASFSGTTLTLSAFNYTSLTNLFGTEEDMSTIIVIVASSVALLSITALGILVIKKRKREQE